MARFAVFTLCLAFLAAGMSVRAAMAMAAITFVALAGYLAWGVSRWLIGTR